MLHSATSCVGCRCRARQTAAATAAAPEPTETGLRSPVHSWHLHLQMLAVMVQGMPQGAHLAQQHICMQIAPKQRASMSCRLVAALCMLACVYLPWAADWGVPWLSQPTFACRYVGVGTPQTQRPASAGALLQSTISALSTLSAPVSAELNSDGEA